MAYCPERVSPGEGGYGVGDVGRVIGSCSVELTETLADLYRGITNGTVTPVSSIEVAEASKLVENAQRDIDIAFANELAILLPKMGLDVQEVLKAAETKWNFHRHTPGIGVGGHCIPIDPHYYMEIARNYGVISALSPAARELNSSMPNHNALEVLRLCNGTHPERILVMGYAYKPNVSDTRETPVHPLVRVLFENGTKEIYVWDPLIASGRVREPARLVPDPYDLEGIDCIIIGTAHDAVIDAEWDRLRANMVSPRIYDGRRCLDPKVMIESGWAFHAIGRPYLEVSD
jgi:nucleotide sugar dehydrogenase